HAEGSSIAEAGGDGSPRTCRKAILAALPASPQPPKPARRTGLRSPPGGSPNTSCIDKVYPSCSGCFEVSAELSAVSYQLEVRPTSRFSAQDAVGRTSV